MIITELKKYANRIVKTGQCQVIGGKLITKIPLREGQGVVIDGKTYTYSSKGVRMVDGDYSLQTLPTNVFGGTYDEFLPLVKQYLPQSNDIIMFCELPVEDEFVDLTTATAFINFSFISKAVLSENTTQAKNEGSYIGFLDKEAEYFVKTMPKYFTLGVTEANLIGIKRLKRSDLVAQGLGLNIIEYRGIKIMYDTRLLPNIVQNCK